MKLFIIHPGWVISRNDGEWHYIGAAQLMKLYQVRPDECIIVDDERPGLNKARIGHLSHILHHLYPLSGLDYRPVTEKERETIRDQLSSHGIMSGYYDGDRRVVK